MQFYITSNGIGFIIGLIAGLIVSFVMGWIAIKAIKEDKEDS